MQTLLREKLLEVLKAVSPLIGFVCILQFTIVQASAALFLQFLFGCVLAITGMILLFAGVDLGILPMGRFTGAELPKKGSLALIIAVAFAFGFATTVAEPDVLVLAGQVDAVSRRGISGGMVLYVIAFGLAALTAIAVVRIIFGWPMKYMLAAIYAVMLLVALATPREYIPVAFDAGSVTTGVLSAPVIIALAIGLSSVLAGRSAVSDGFGLLGFASVGPVIALLLMGILLS
jgi:hypothetical protein